MVGPYLTRVTSGKRLDGENPSRERDEDLSAEEESILGVHDRFLYARVSRCNSRDNVQPEACPAQNGLAMEAMDGLDDGWKDGWGNDGCTGRDGSEQWMEKSVGTAGDRDSEHQYEDTGPV